MSDPNYKERQHAARPEPKVIHRATAYGMWLGTYEVGANARRRAKRTVIAQMMSAGATRKQAESILRSERKRYNNEKIAVTAKGLSNELS